MASVIDFQPSCTLIQKHSNGPIHSRYRFDLTLSQFTTNIERSERNVMARISVICFLPAVLPFHVWQREKKHFLFVYYVYV